MLKYGSHKYVLTQCIFPWFHVSKMNLVLTRHLEQCQSVDMMRKCIKYEHVNGWM
jgi:hypothetical protein